MKFYAKKAVLQCSAFIVGILFGFGGMRLIGNRYRTTESGPLGKEEGGPPGTQLDGSIPNHQSHQRSNGSYKDILRSLRKEQGLQSDRKGEEALVAEWIEGDPIAAFQWLEQQPQSWFGIRMDLTRLELYRIAALRAAELDPIFVMQQMAMRPQVALDVRSGLVFGEILAKAAIEDSDEALATIARLQTDGNLQLAEARRLRKRVIEAVFNSGKRTEAFELAMPEGGSLKFSEVSGLLSEWYLESSSEAMAWIESKYDGAGAGAARLAMAGELLYKNSEKTCELLLDMPQSSESVSLMSRSLLFLSRQDPELYRAFIDRISERPDASVVLTPLLSVLANESPTMAVEIVNNQSSRPVGEAYVQSLGSRLLLSEPERALDAVALIDDVRLRAQGESYLIRSYANRNWVAAAHYVFDSREADRFPAAARALVSGSEELRSYLLHPSSDDPRLAEFNVQQIEILRLAAEDVVGAASNPTMNK